MPEPIIPTNTLSSNYDHSVSAATLKKLCEWVSEYEPGIFKIIADMCGVHFQVPLSKVAGVLADFNLNRDGVERARIFARYFSPIEQRIRTHSGLALTRGYIEAEADYVIGRYIEETQNTNMAYRKLEVMRSICQYWGIHEEDYYSKVAWANRINAQDPTECTLIFWNAGISYNNTDMTRYISNLSKQAVEILIPRTRENREELFSNHPFPSESALNYMPDPQTWENSYLDRGTENNYIKMYRGMCVAAFRKKMGLMPSITPSMSLRLYRFQHYHHQPQDEQAEDEGESTRNPSPENDARLSIEADQREIVRLFEQHIEREQT